MTNQKNDTRYHEVLKQASIYVYHGQNAQLPADYRIIDKAENKKNGFYAEAYSNGKDIIIAYRGTEGGFDIQNDIAMAKKNIPAQASDAISFHDKIQRENPTSEIATTGHSLGGSLSEIVSAIRGTVAVTFNAYGVKDMFTSNTRLKENNIVNYVNESDGITMVNGENHLGEIYTVPSIANPSKNPIAYKWNCHKAEGIGKLSQRVQKTPTEIKETADRLHPNSSRIKNNINRNSSNHTSSSTQCVGSYTVSGYTRSDGKEVNSYTRTCGAKHNS